MASARAQLEPFVERDFLVFASHRQDDPELNALRLGIRRKLQAIADETKRRAKVEGVDLSSQGGLHHPHSFNSFRVRGQRAYLCRSDAQRRALAKFFGEALGQDAKTHYIQLLLEVAIDGDVVESALRIHPQAWWDGEHLRKRVTAPGGLEEFCTMLRALPAGFALRIHDWKKIWWASSAKPFDLKEFFASYTPGQHWLHVVRELPKEDAVALGPEGPLWAIDSQLTLLPLFTFMRWEPA